MAKKEKDIVPSDAGTRNAKGAASAASNAKKKAASSAKKSPAASQATAVKKTTIKKTVAKKAVAKKTAAKKATPAKTTSTAKKTTAKAASKATPKKVSAKKATAKKTTTAKASTTKPSVAQASEKKTSATPKKVAAKASAKKAVSKKAPAAKATAKATAKKAAAKKTVAKKTTTPKATSKATAKKAAKKVTTKKATPQKTTATKAPVTKTAAKPTTQTTSQKSAPMAIVAEKAPVAAERSPSQEAPTFGLNPDTHEELEPKAVYNSIKPITAFRDDRQPPRDFDRTGGRLPTNPMTVKLLRPIAREQIMMAFGMDNDDADASAAEHLEAVLTADKPVESDTMERDALPVRISTSTATKPDATKSAPSAKHASTKERKVVADEALTQTIRSAHSDTISDTTTPVKKSSSPKAAKKALNTEEAPISKTATPAAAKPETKPAQASQAHERALHNQEEKGMAASQVKSTPTQAVRSNAMSHEKPATTEAVSTAMDTPEMEEADAPASLLALMMRDPSSIFLYWFIEPVDAEALADELGPKAMQAGEWVLRLTRLENNLTVTIPVDITANRHYAVVEPHSTYVAELGFRHPGGYKAVVRGNTVSTPRLTISEHVDPSWSTSYEELLRLMALGQYRGQADESSEEQTANSQHVAAASMSLSLNAQDEGTAASNAGSMGENTGQGVPPHAQMIAVGPLSSMILVQPISGVNLSERAEQIRMQLSAPISSHVLGGSSSFSFQKEMQASKKDDGTKKK